MVAAKDNKNQFVGTKKIFQTHRGEANVYDTNHMKEIEKNFSKKQHKNQKKKLQSLEKRYDLFTN